MKRDKGYTKSTDFHYLGIYGGSSQALTGAQAAAVQREMLEEAKKREPKAKRKG